ncbi:hypothetical protein DNL40_01140 [Xylanimonas oleitrophica]|uniref:Uncharacterized protein n=1 Tax=Xylanimonas oleitrophica TaxID=2607479 RepID=A0A2W5YIU9_9MICO|nr:hypothetical protein [Xylanimonas oleitrophica]PZR55031.1 hypothetical protein DNL40_01140 [Xylanimonas oleitrophica]
MDPRDDARESGRILLLSLGFVVIGLMLVGMVASASAVHLDRKRLFDVTDLVAADAADSAPPAQVLAGLDGPAAASRLPLTDADVRASVQRYLVEHGGSAGSLRDLRVVEASAPDGATARVTLAATSHPPLVRWFTRAFDAGIGLSATSTARAALQ